MSEYIIVTDSSCDLREETLREWNVASIQLDVLVEGEDNRKNNEIEPKEFFGKLRDGKTARTSAVNIAGFKEFFAPLLQQGKDVLYLGFSSGLSTTYQSAVIAATELAEEYPQNRVVPFDTLCASVGQGMFLSMALQKQNSGATIEEVCAYLEELRPRLAHWFTVDDLMFLKRGGRISGTVALVGTMLGIKPILHMDDEGHLVNITKVRGRAAAIEALADKYGETVFDRTAPVCICHGDCLEDAEKLASIMKEKYGVDILFTEFVGPVIGAHSGPGTLALFFVANER